MAVKILYVDNSEHIDLLQRHLIRKGYNVTLVKTPEKAEEFLRTQKCDLVISDVFFDSFPDRGIAFIDKLVKMGQRFMVTSASDISDISELQKMELPFLEKPFGFEEFDGFITKVLSAHTKIPKFNPKKFKSLIISHTDTPMEKHIKRKLNQFNVLNFKEKRQLVLELELNQLKKEILQTGTTKLDSRELNELMRKYTSISKELTTGVIGGKLGKVKSRLPKEIIRRRLQRPR